MTNEPIMTPTHPGVILREEFLEPMGITDCQLAKDQLRDTLETIHPIAS